MPAMAHPLPLPKYHRIYLVLREQLREGQFAAGLPGELALMEQFGVARVTVRRALAELAREGLIAREPGRGTRPLERGAAAADTAPPMRTHLTGLLENLVSMGLRTAVKGRAGPTGAGSDRGAAGRGGARGAQGQKAGGGRSTAAGPLSHITTYVPAAVAQGFGRRELEVQPILLLLEQSGVKVGRAVQTISARLADAEVARQLDLPVGSALLAVRRLIFDEQERPVQWLHGLYRPDRYEYEMQLSRVGSIDAKVWVSTDLAAHFQ